jgi:hypothetical protein
MRRPDHGPETVSGEAIKEVRDESGNYPDADSNKSEREKTSIVFEALHDW